MKLVEHTISMAELEQMSQTFDGVVKAVVDVDKGIMVVDTEMHADGEAFLLDQGSEQENVWGINLHPHMVGDNWIEFDSLINIPPSWGNRSRSVDDAATREAIIKIVNRLAR